MIKSLEDFIVVDTHPDLLNYVDDLQKKNAEALSFYPKQVFEREAENKRLLLALLNGHPCGYIYMGAAGKTIRCHQVCIQYDARLRRYGEMLVMDLEHRAIGSQAIALRCGFDLDANKFWQSMGYHCVDIQDGGIRRKRRINVWRKQLQPALFDDFILTPEEGKTSSAQWVKRDKSKGISQFSRGKKMSQYRTIVERECGRR